jgi:hypothetical protein
VAGVSDEEGKIMRKFFSAVGRAVRQVARFFWVDCGGREITQIAVSMRLMRLAGI